MEITSLIENKVGGSKNLQAEHGLSLYIEVDNKKILFDTGRTGEFIDNAKKLRINLEELDYVIISHGHYDHSGGLKRLIKEINPRIKLIVGEGFFQNKYKLKGDSEYEFAGNNFRRVFIEENSSQVNNIKEDVYWITDNLFVFTNFNRDEKYENRNNTMYLEKNGEYIKDDFADEISLGITTDEGLLVVVGCSHPGIINIVDTISKKLDMKVSFVVGGTHLVNENKKQINKVIHYFMKNDVKLLAACHCTGSRAQSMFAKQLKDKFINYNTGEVLKW